MSWPLGFRKYLVETRTTPDKRDELLGRRKEALNGSGEPWIGAGELWMWEVRLREGKGRATSTD